ncbi:MAG: diphosphomevalonate decarboxylase [Pseudomonadales bacterium]|nr:diphosphomevalonate decarboxylase [Pseudomonadales bacterium]
MTKAIAHPNIALVKYWGKQDKPGNLPATPSLSITLDGLVTETVLADAATDRFVINGQQQQDAKVADFLTTLRQSHAVPPLEIVTINNFPTGAGLASSASGFAALMTAINTHCQLGLNSDLISEWARQGSASAARSVYGGFVNLAPPLWRASPAASTNHWPLNVVIAITSEEKKAVGSTEGMRRTPATSPFYDAWEQGAAEDYTTASNAIARRDFSALAGVAELSCLKMHSIMLTSTPTLSYWNPSTVACMDEVRRMRAAGIATFFTIDAGPQVKAVCLPDSVAQVRSALSEVPGVLATHVCALGGAARVLD